MRRNGFVTRSGPGGWDVFLYDEEQRGILPRQSDLYEIIRQASELLLSSREEGVICGSNRKFKPYPSPRTGARTLTIKMAGFTLNLRQNQNPSSSAEVNFTMISDFEFPQVENATGPAAEEPQG